MRSASPSPPVVTYLVERTSYRTSPIKTGNDGNKVQLIYSYSDAETRAGTSGARAKAAKNLFLMQYHNEHSVPAGNDDL